MGKVPKKLFPVVIDTAHTAKKIQIFIDASRWALRLKASACADELYVVLAEFHHYTLM
jgi:hypothetical protein